LEHRDNETNLYSLGRFLSNNPLLKREKIARLLFDVSKLVQEAIRTKPRFRKVEWAELSAGPESQVFIRHHKHKWLVFSTDHHISRSLYIHGEFDFKKLIRASKIIGSKCKSLVLLDVGANLGSICIPGVADGYFDSAIAIEARPDVAELLKTNVALNKLEDRVRVIASAVGPPSSKSLDFSVDKSNFGASRVSRLNSEKTISVGATTLDLVVAEPSKIGLVFMDIEGFEVEALKGARSILLEFPAVALEFTPKLLHEFSTRADFLRIFDGYSYFYSLNDPLRKKYHIKKLEKIWDWYESEKGIEQTDLLFLRS